MRSWCEAETQRRLPLRTLSPLKTKIIYSAR